MIIKIIKAGICALLAGGLAWFARSDSVARINQLNAPDTALLADAGQPYALLAKADQIISANALNLPKDKLKAMARTALINQALMPKAIRTLAFVEPDAKSMALIRLAEKTSRRELYAQILLIEDAVSRNDVPTALKHYDIALSTAAPTENSGFALLMPILSQALEDGEVRSHFAKMIRKKPIWLFTALGYLVSASKQPQYVADLLLQSGPLPNEPQYRTYESILLSRLHQEKQVQMALRYYISLPGANKALINDPRFLKENTDGRLTPVHWSVTASDANEGSFTPQGDGKPLLLDAYTGNGRLGRIAFKLAFLPPGTYKVREAAKPKGEPTSAYGTLEIFCWAPEGRKSIWRSRFSEFDKAAPIIIGKDCTAQDLDITLASEGSKPGGTLIGSPLIEKVS